MRFLLLIAVILPVQMAAADFCAIYVNVINSTGKPIDAPVALIDKDGNVETSIIAQNGKATLCDIGFGPHTIRVGKLECSGYVTIHNISLIYGLAQSFTATWDGCRNVEMMTLPPSCQVAFRVTSSDNKKLNDAEATKKGDTAKYHADSYGRFFLDVANGSKVDFTFSAHGYRERMVSVPCEHFENIEKSVQLDPK
jgi:hypothetical protein